MQSNCENTIFRTEQVENFCDAIAEAEGAVVDLKAAAADAGSIDFRFMDETRDLVPVLDQEEISADDFFEAVQGGPGALSEFERTVRAAKSASPIRIRSCWL